MNEELNISIRRFLKQVGISSQKKIERALSALISEMAPGTALHFKTKYFYVTESNSSFLVIRRDLQHRTNRLTVADWYYTSISYVCF